MVIVDCSHSLGRPGPIIYPPPRSNSLVMISWNYTLCRKDENNLCIFERRILRKIFGPVDIDNIWRIRNNMEIDKLLEGADSTHVCAVQSIYR